MTISRSRTMLPSFPNLTLNDVALKDTSELNILGVTFDPKLTFERHVRSVAKTQKLKTQNSLLKKAEHVYNKFYNKKDTK